MYEGNSTLFPFQSNLGVQWYFCLVWNLGFFSLDFNFGHVCSEMVKQCWKQHITRKTKLLRSFLVFSTYLLYFLALWQVAITFISQFLKSNINHIPLIILGHAPFLVFGILMHVIVQFRVHYDRWIKKVKTHFFTGLASIWSNISKNFNEKKTFLLLCPFQTLCCRNFWIFYFMSRLTLYKFVVNVCVQR